MAPANDITPATAPTAADGGVDPNILAAVNNIFGSTEVLSS